MGVKQGELVIEINHPKNADQYFRPIKKSLRSRFLTPRSGPGAKAPLNAFATTPIPGQRIHLDWKKRVGRITDPLSEPESKDLLEQMNRVWSQIGQSGRCGPLADEEFKNLTEEAAYSWLYYMRDLVEGHRNSAKLYENAAREDEVKFTPFAEVIAGEWPAGLTTLLAIRQTGKVLTYNMRSSPPGARTLPVLTKDELEIYGHSLAAAS